MRPATHRGAQKSETGAVGSKRHLGWRCPVRLVPSTHGVAVKTGTTGMHEHELRWRRRCTPSHRRARERAHLSLFRWVCPQPPPQPLLKADCLFRCGHLAANMPQERFCPLQLQSARICKNPSEVWIHLGQNTALAAVQRCVVYRFRNLRSNGREHYFYQ